MNRKAVSIVLMILGVALFLGVIVFIVDQATSSEPTGLGTVILTVLGLVLSAAAGIKGWVDWNKKDAPSQTTTVTATDNSIAVGNITVGGSIGGNLIIGNTISTAEKVPNSLHQLPPPPADFTGREDLIARLLADFHTHQGAAITGRPTHVHGLIGMGGIGKTALGLVVAHKIKDGYPDAQIFLDLKGTTTPLSAMDIMRHVILSFEPAMDVRALDETNMQAVYRSLLYEKRALLFLDNARSAEQVAPLQPPETCAMLVTSRWVFRVPKLSTHHVDVMSEAEAKAFLLELCPRVREHAGELAGACSYLPLALRIAGSFLDVNDHWGVDKYLERLKDHTQRLITLEESRAQVDLSQEHPYLRASFELSYGQLSEEDKKRWRVLGVFPASFDAQAAQAVWGLEEEATLKLLGLLRRYSLLEYNETSSRYSLHDLLADYACSQMGKEEDYEARLRHAAHYKDVLSAADDLYQEGGENIMPGLRLFDLEWENIRIGRAWVAENTANTSCLEVCNEYPNAGYMILPLRLHPRERISWLERGLEAAQKLGDKKYEGYHLGNLGLAYAALGEARKAIEYYEGHLKIAREIGDRRGEGAALGNLGIAYKNLGEARKAIEYYEQALVIDREIGDRRGEGAALFNMGLALYGLEKKDRAVGLVKEALAIYEAIESPYAENARNTLREWGISINTECV